MQRFIHGLCFCLLFATLPASAKVKHTFKGDGRQRSDIEIRALLRKSAPFYVDEHFRGDTVRINKDGTFSRATEDGGFQTDGHWKVSSGKLKMKWSNGEEYGYRMTFSGHTPLLVGHKPDKSGHYTIISMD